MKKRFVIITLNDLVNYGNRLQNYALTKILENYGEVNTAYCAGFRNMPAWCARIFHSTVQLAKEIIGGIKARDIGSTLTHYRKCRNFTKKYVPDTELSIDVKHGARPKKYLSSTFIFGSDQIWNYANANSQDGAKLFSLYLGSFLPQRSNCISYAASIGISKKPNEMICDLLNEYLPRFSAISVREFAGEELIKDITGLDAQVVLDPTLMLTAEQWISITEEFVAAEDSYVLTYFLGKPTDKQQSDINSYAETHGCRVRKILNLSDSETYKAGPQDFVELIAKAEYVFTDSYHACCFSILFHKQFTVFNRSFNNTLVSGKTSMNSRMETLFKLFGLNTVVMDYGLSPFIDYEKLDVRLSEYRKLSAHWLEQALERLE